MGEFWRHRLEIVLLTITSLLIVAAIVVVAKMQHRQAAVAQISNNNLTFAGIAGVVDLLRLRAPLAELADHMSDDVRRKARLRADILVSRARTLSEGKFGRFKLQNPEVGATIERLSALAARTQQALRSDLSPAEAEWLVAELDQMERPLLGLASRANQAGGDETAAGQNELRELFKIANWTSFALVACGAVLLAATLATRRSLRISNETLAETNRQLQSRNAELNSLMAIAAHDLRSPLHGLDNLLELVTDHPPASTDVWDELLHEARASVALMLALIGRILEAHEAETHGRRDCRERTLHLAAEGAVRRARPLATRNGIDLDLHLEKGDQPVVVTVDPDALDQIIDNLVSNALCFSPRGSKVRIVVGADPVPSVAVVDEGVGISPDGRDRLFGKFQRGATPPIHGPRGSGLGLYIVATLAAAIEAKVTYHPRNEGGSSFVIEFPVKGRSLPATISVQ